MSKLTASLLVYDIPDVSDFPNPSGFLRSRAVRINLSCWVVPNGAMIDTMLDRMTKAGVKWRMPTFDAGDAGEWLAVCIDALKQDICVAVKRCGQSVRKAQFNAEDKADGVKQTKLYIKRTGGQMNRLKKMLADFKKVSEAFGISGDMDLTIRGAETAVTTMTASVKTRSELYVQATEQLRALGTVDAIALANAAAEDRCPWYAMADFLDEHDPNPNAGAALRLAYTPPAPKQNELAVA